MSKDVHRISEDASTLTAARVMVEKGINSLIVWPTERDEPYGILTSSDVEPVLPESCPLFFEVQGEYWKAI